MADEEFTPSEYEKDGVTKTAQTPTEQVDLEFHGWTQKKKSKSSGGGSSGSGSSSSSSSGSK